MRNIGLVFVCFAILISSCNNKDENKTGVRIEKTSAATISVPVRPNFNPYTMVVVEQAIPSIDLWLPVFNAHESERKASGLTVLRIGRNIDDSNSVFIRMSVDDLNKAKEFLEVLKEDTRKAGRTVDPKFSFLNVLRDDSSYTDIKERAIVSYHVKDFDKWLKVYDEKGKATREPHGLIDRGLARGVDDPSVVYVLFAVSDIRKARARFASSELRRILRNAGVDSRMTVSYYKVVQ